MSIETHRYLYEIWGYKAIVCDCVVQTVPALEMGSYFRSLLCPFDVPHPFFVCLVFVCLFVLFVEHLLPY